MDKIRGTPVKDSPLRHAANLVMGYVQFLLIGMLIFTLVLGYRHFTAGYDVTVTTIVKYSGEIHREKLSLHLSDIYETREYAGFTMASLAYGVCNIVLSGFAGYVVFLRFRGHRRMRNLVKHYSLTGLSVNLAYLLLVWILDVQKENMGGITMKAVISPHFTLWLSMLCFSILLGASLLSRKRRGR